MLMSMVCLLNLILRYHQVVLEDNDVVDMVVVDDDDDDVDVENGVMGLL